MWAHHKSGTYKHAPLDKNALGASSFPSHPDRFNQIFDSEVPEVLDARVLPDAAVFYLDKSWSLSVVAPLTGLIVVT